MISLEEVMNKEKANNYFSRKVLLILSILIILLAFFGVLKKYNDNIKNNFYEITMLGGSNIKEKGDVNSMGYILKTKNNKLIVVDGGRDIDAELVMNYINSVGNGKVDYWFLTHAHNDHIGAIVKILEDDSYNVVIDNLCYNFNTKDWYTAYDPTRSDIAIRFFEYFEKNKSSAKVKNTIICKENDLIEIDNLSCKILRVANSEIKESLYVGNEASMVFKFMMKKSENSYSDKTMLFLGDSYIEASKELLDNHRSELKSYAVQMAHHGQNGVIQEVYDAIDPKICFFNCPKWLYDNDDGNGYNSGNWQSIEVQSWIENNERKTKSTLFKAYEGDVTLKITDKGYTIID